MKKTWKVLILSVLTLAFGIYFFHPINHLDGFVAICEEVGGEYNATCGLFSPNCPDCCSTEEGLICDSDRWELVKMKYVWGERS